MTDNYLTKKILRHRVQMLWLYAQWMLAAAVILAIPLAFIGLGYRLIEFVLEGRC